jgi:hypothetical protein
MSKKKPLLAALDKKTRERHFPESNGSHARKSTAETSDKFKSGYDGIDWSKK